MADDYQISLRHSLETLPLGLPPEPWSRRGDYAVGGLTEIGFAPDADVLLVVSSQGRGLFDCRTGSKLARDPAEDWDGLDETHLVSPGFGDWAQTMFRLAGLHGGGLPMTTADGWGLHCVPLPWPQHFVFISRPWKSHMFDQWTKIATDNACEFRACGFSDTGRSFVVASSCELLIFARAEA